MITGGLSLISSLFGNRQTAEQRARAALLMQQAKIMQQAYAMAANYDPNRETRIAADYATAQTGRALTNATKNLNKEFKLAGGSPTGDTNFAFRQQRTQDDLLNPLSQFLADRRANAFALKLNALTQAGGMGGQTAAGLGALNADNQAASGGYQQGIAAILQGMMNPNSGNRGVGDTGMSQSAIDYLVGRKNGTGKKNDFSVYG